MAKGKPQPVKRGQYMPLPFDAILSPDGQFYRAARWKHHKVAFEVTGEDWDDCLEKGWLRMSAGVCCYAFTWQEPTQAQIDALFDYARFMQWTLLDVFESSKRRKAAEFLGITA